jgi:hypothetical protein
MRRKSKESEIRDRKLRKLIKKETYLENEMCDFSNIELNIS